MGAVVFVKMFVGINKKKYNVCDISLINAGNKSSAKM